MKKQSINEAEVLVGYILGSMVMVFPQIDPEGKLLDRVWCRGGARLNESPVEDDGEVYCSDKFLHFMYRCIEAYFNKMGNELDAETRAQIDRGREMLLALVETVQGVNDIFLETSEERQVRMEQEAVTTNKHNGRKKAGGKTGSPLDKLSYLAFR